MSQVTPAARSARPVAGSRSVTRPWERSQRTPPSGSTTPNSVESNSSSPGGRIMARWMVAAASARSSGCTASSTAGVEPSVPGGRPYSASRPGDPVRRSPSACHSQFAMRAASSASRSWASRAASAARLAASSALARRSPSFAASEVARSAMRSARSCRVLDADWPAAYQCLFRGILTLR
jgi:hypothetical protein